MKLEQWKDYISKEAFSTKIDNILNDAIIVLANNKVEIRGNKQRITCYFHIDRKPKQLMLWNEKSNDIELSFEQEKVLYNKVKTFLIDRAL